MSALEAFAIGMPAIAGTRSPTLSAMGAKAHHLLRMNELGLPVPPAFVLGTRHCAETLATGGLSRAVRDALPALLAGLESATGRRLGDARNPLLVSVRSGAPVSMPGMMQTLLNIGLSSRTFDGFLACTGNPRLAWDAYRRLVVQYGSVVAGLPEAKFDELQLATTGERDERLLDFSQLRSVAQRGLDLFRELSGASFPQDPHEQLERAITAVYASWNAPHAQSYRHTHGIPDAPGTAVIVQAMVFGNSGGKSGAGVGFTRDPTTGEPGLWVDYLDNAQGEDVVSGRRVAHGAGRLAVAAPSAWHQLVGSAAQLEHAFADMQDFEFTIDDGRLYMLQTRAGKRSDLAALRILLDLHEEGIIDADEARRRAAAIDVERLAIRRIETDGGVALVPIAEAASANAGVTTGEIALDEAQARTRVAAGAAVVLVRRDAETADLAALELAQGLLTQRGARTSHAAVVARQLGKVCLVGCETLEIDASERRVRLGDRTLREGDVVTLDGNTGAVYAGAARIVSERPLALLARLARLQDALETAQDLR